MERVGPGIYRLPSGEFAIVGIPAPDLADRLPAGLGDNEEIVVIPREALVRAKEHIEEPE